MSNQDHTTDSALPEATRPTWLIPAGFVLLLLQGLRTIGHADFWTHLAAGQAGLSRMDPLTWVSYDQTWVHVHHLYDRTLALLFGLGGAPLLTLLHVLATLGAFGLLVRVIRPQANPASIALSLCLSVWLLAPRFEVRPETLALLFAALFIFVLSKDSTSWRLWGLLLPVQVIWANTDTSFIWGPFMALLFAIQAYWGPPRNLRTFALVLPHLGLVVALLLVSLINPHFTEVYRASLHTLAAPVLRDWISPLSGLFPSALTRNLITLALIIGAIGLLTRRERLPLALTALAMISAFLAVRAAMAYLSWFALFAFPFFCLSLDALHKLLQRKSSLYQAHGHRLWAITVALVVVISGALLVSNRYYTHAGHYATFGLGIADQGTAKGALRHVVHAPGFPESFLNLPMDGGYLAYHRPGQRAYIDQRGEVHGSHTYRRLLNGLLGDADAWDAIQARDNPQAILLNHAWLYAIDTLRFLHQQGEWRWIYFDGVSSVLVRNHPDHAALLDRTEEFRQLGLQELATHQQTHLARLGGVQRPPVSPALVGASLVFRARGLTEKADYCQSLVSAGAPNLDWSLLVR